LEGREVNLFGRNTREEVGESGISEFTSTFFCDFAIAGSEVELLILFEFSEQISIGVIVVDIGRIVGESGEGI